MMVFDVYFSLVFHFAPGFDVGSDVFVRIQHWRKSCNMILRAQPARTISSIFGL